MLHIRFDFLTYVADLSINKVCKGLLSSLEDFTLKYLNYFHIVVVWFFLWKT